MKLLRRFLDSLWHDADTENKRFVLNLIERKDNTKVLDIGCSNGDFSRKVANKIGTEQIFGLDIVMENTIKASRENNINVILANAELSLPFKDNTFDMVVSNQLIEHLGNTDTLIKEIFRILRQKGICVVSTPNLASFHSIISLVFGYQPTCTGVSDEFICGNPFDPRYKTIYRRKTQKMHRRLFTAPALRELFEFHRFHIEKVTGWGLHPLPLFISKHFKLARYCLFLTIKAKKLGE